MTKTKKESQHLVVLIFCFFAYINLFLNQKLPAGLILNPLVLIPFIITIYLTKKIRLRLVKFVIFSWLSFFIFGVLFTTQSYYQDFFWRILKLDNASLIYGIYMLCFTFCCYYFENRNSAKRNYVLVKRSKVIPKPFLWFLLIFPFIWTISFYLAVGKIPILSGVSFYEDVYNTNYGSLYGYIAYISLSVVACFYMYQVDIQKSNKYIYLFLILIFFFFSIIDGKRYTIFTSLLAMVVYLIASPSVKVPKFKLIVFGCVIIGIYVFVHAVRVGGVSDLLDVNVKSISVPIGGEFRDFVYSENKFKPGEIKGYNYTLSTLVSMLNGGFLGLLGVDKNTISQMGSAYAWKNIYNDLFGTDLGIRTGIISELYFAYSYFGVLVFGIFAYFLVMISDIIENRKADIFYVLICAVIYALFVMLIVGQTTTFIGQVVLLLYLALAYRMYRAFGY